MEPINTQRADDAARAYTAQGWPLSVGNRHRPRQGCSCGTLGCPTSGAHPRPDAPVYVRPETIVEELEKSPGAGPIAWTARFDALVLPSRAGMAVMASLERIAQVPCIITDTHVTLLVLPATGRYAQAEGVDVTVRSGAGGWIALPPSHGTRWDTPPWVEQTTAPVDVLHGRDVGRALDGISLAASAGMNR